MSHIRSDRGRSRRLVLALVAGIVSASTSVSQRGGRPILDPATHTSPSGAYALHVDPTHRDGRGAADYRLTRDGERVWASHLPWSFQEAIVTDNGTCLGYAYTAGLGEFEGGELILALIASDGEVVLEEGLQRKPHRMHSPDSPMGLGIVHHPALGIASIRIDDPRSSPAEVWWSVDLELRKWAGSVVPRTAIGGGEGLGAVYAARPVAGTELTLLHWRLRTESSGARFTLVDPLWNVLWSLDLPGDYQNVRDPSPTSLRSGVGIPNEVPEHFSILRARDREYAIYEVTPGAGGEVAVKDVGRRPYLTPEPDPGPPVTPLVLDRVGRVSYADAPPIHRSRRAAILGPGDHLFVFDGRSGAVHVFDRDGDAVGLYEPDPGDYPRMPYPPNMSMDGRGHLFVLRGTSVAADTTYIEFDGSGSRLGAVRYPGRDLAFLPGGQRAWVGLLHSVVRVGPQRGEELRLLRRADRSWFRPGLKIAVAADGSLAVLEEQVTTFDASGQIQASYALPHRRGIRSPYSMSHDHGWIALGEPGRVLLVRKVDGALFSFRPFADGSRPAVLIPAGGGELWLFDFEHRVLDRYSWPAGR